MKSISAAVLLMVVGLGVQACKDFPGADGRYATHDRGALNRYALTSNSSGPPCSDGGRAVSNREGRELDRSWAAATARWPATDDGARVGITTVRLVLPDRQSRCRAIFADPFGEVEQCHKKSESSARCSWREPM